MTRAQELLGEDADTAAQTLRDQYRYDWGQIENLACLHLATDIKEYAERVEARKEQGPWATEIDQLPKLLGIKRAEAFGILREKVNAGREEAALDDAGIIALLWQEHGDDPNVLKSLALEYLAQGTPLLSNAVTEITAHARIDDPVKDIEKLVASAARSPLPR